MAVILCQQGLRHLPGPLPTQACPSISADLSLQGAFPLGRLGLLLWGGEHCLPHPNPVPSTV